MTCSNDSFIVHHLWRVLDLSQPLSKISPMMGIRVHIVQHMRNHTQIGLPCSSITTDSELPVRRQGHICCWASCRLEDRTKSKRLHRICIIRRQCKELLVSSKKNRSPSARGCPQLYPPKRPYESSWNTVTTRRLEARRPHEGNGPALPGFCALSVTPYGAARVIPCP